MNTLFDNAIQSIQLGLEDYKSNDPKRPLSAVRNFYSGLLLLAKETLVRAAPNADARVILAAKLNIKLNDQGAVEIEADGHKTIDFETITERLRRFNIRVEKGLLTQLNKIRNDIEHAHTQANQATVREAIAKAFPVVVTLFRQMHMDPAIELGDTWAEMAEAKAIYEAELKECKTSLQHVIWNPDFLRTIPHICPDCDSKLIEQIEPDNTDFQSARFKCRQCGEENDAEAVFTHSLSDHFYADAYIAMTDGGEPPVEMCPECALNTYVNDGEYIGCVWCGTELEQCARCSTGLTPNNVDPDNSSLCDYCGHLMSKDD